ncbi:MAG: LamG domain-containing protein, partial [Candidatus Omnitrophota bacterium]
MTKSMFTFAGVFFSVLLISDLLCCPVFSDVTVSYYTDTGYMRAKKIDSEKSVDPEDILYRKRVKYYYRNEQPLPGLSQGALDKTEIFGDTTDEVERKGIAFDGKDDYLRAADSEILDAGTSDLTITAWIKLSEVNKFMTIVNKNGYRAIGPSYHLGIDDYGKVHFTLSDGTAEVNTYGRALRQTLEKDRWYHIALTLDRDGMGKVYIDGVLDYAVDISAITGSVASDAELNIGRRTAGTRLYFSGDMDDVATYSSALAGGDLAGLCEGGNITGGVSAAWNFNEGSGVRAWDSSGNGNDAEIKGGAARTALGAPAERSGALVFNGSASYAEVPYNGSLDAGSGDFTATVWIKADKADSFGTILNKNGHKSCGASYHLGIDDYGKIHFTLSDGNTEINSYGLSGRDKLEAGTWYHIALVVERGEKATVYIDGGEDYSVDISSLAGGIDDGTFLSIGRRAKGTKLYFDGSMDDLLIYDRALSGGEIADIYGGSSIDSGCAAAWYFSEGTGTDLKDSAGINNGVVRGAEWFSGGADDTGLPEAVILEQADENGVIALKYEYSVGGVPERAFGYYDRDMSVLRGVYQYDSSGNVVSFSPENRVKYITYSAADISAGSAEDISVSCMDNMIWQSGGAIYYKRASDGTVTRLNRDGEESLRQKISAGTEAVWVTKLENGYAADYCGESSGFKTVRIFENHEGTIDGMSAWHLDNWAPVISPNGRYIAWVDYRVSSNGGRIFLYDTHEGLTIQVTGGDFIYRRPQVDDSGNMIWQDNTGYAGNIFTRDGVSGAIRNVSEPDGRKGWDPQLNNGYAAWQSNSDIMIYDFGTGERSNLEDAGGYGVQDWDPVINARGDVLWKGGPLWEGTDMYLYCRDEGEVKRLNQDDTQDAVSTLNNSNGFAAWEKHLSGGEKELYFFDGENVVLVTRTLYLAPSGNAFHISASGDLLWAETRPEGGVVMRYDRETSCIEAVSGDYADISGNFAMNSYGDIAWKGETDVYISKAYSYIPYASGSIKRCSRPDGEVIEYLDSPAERVTLIYDPYKKVYRTFDWDDAAWRVTVKTYSGVYAPSPGDDVRERPDAGYLQTVEVYSTAGDTDPLDGTPFWDTLDRHEFFYDKGGDLIMERVNNREVYLNGDSLPVKVMNGENEVFYRIKSIAGEDVTMSLDYYESFPLLKEAFGCFELGASGENVFLKYIYSASHIKKIYVFVSGTDRGPETGIEWQNSKMINNAEYFLVVLTAEASGALKTFLGGISLENEGIETRDELAEYVYARADSNGYTKGDVDRLIDHVAENYKTIANDSIENDTVYEIDPEKFSLYNIYPHLPVCEAGRENGEYAFTYYPSGRVRTVFGKSLEARLFTRAEEATGKIYEYADEPFYAEEEARLFLSRLIYRCPGRLSGGALKYFLTRLDIDAAGISGPRSLLDHLYANAGEENNYTMEDVDNLAVSVSEIAPYTEHGRLLKEVFPDGSYKVYEYNGNTAEVSGVKTYSSGGALIEKRVRAIEEKEFIGMGSLPWLRYGEGIGVRHTDNWHSGYSRERSGDEELTGKEELYAALKKWEGGYVRIFLFGDGRSGLDFDGSGNFTGFSRYVIEDMKALLDTAKELDIKIIPVIFDYRIADFDEEGEAEEHVRLISDETERA